MKSSWFQRYLLPGFVFQSLIIGGGYGTGRELVEFFLNYGPWGGLLAMLLPSTVFASVTCLVSFEFARVFRTYDYRTFFRRLLGPAWFLFDAGFIVAILLVLAVLGSAAGIILLETFHVPYALGVSGLLAVVGVLVFLGTGAIERFLAAWSFVLYAMYIALFVWALRSFGGQVSSTLAGGGMEPGWLVSGARYGALQASLVPAMLFVVRHFRGRKEAVVAGALAGPIGVIPGLLFYIVMLGQYPAILERPVPVNYLLEILGSRAFQIGFQVVLFGTLIETGAAFIHGFNERVASVYADRDHIMPRFLRPTIAVLALVLAALLSRIGIVDLIAKGYGTLTWIFILVYVAPLLTWGIVLLRRHEKGRG